MDSLRKEIPMLKKNISIQISPQATLDHHVVTLSEKLFKSLRIPIHHHITLHFGSSKSQIKIISAAHVDGLRISQGLAKKIGLPFEMKLNIIYLRKTQRLKLGHILGVMVNQIRTQPPTRPFGNITSFCNELTVACQAEGGFVYYFSPESLKARSKQIDGWSYHGSWHKLSLPVPDVIYNRLTSRVLENKNSVQHFMKEVKSLYNTKIFNEKYLNKTEVFGALKKERSLHPYLPQSHTLRNSKMLKMMCEKYATVFVKPNLGSLGKGIIKITKQSNESYTCDFAVASGTKTRTFNNLTSLYAFLKTRMKVRRYQIQRGLRLIRVGSRPVDFRALVQKNDENKWSVTSIVARIAGNHHIVSNLARGGSLSSVLEALQKAKLSNSHYVNTKLRKAAVEIAQGIEKHIPKQFGELGVDLAVDTSGRVWLLEVNSKPSKNDSTPLSDNKIRPSVKQVAKYVRHLSGFNK